ncbi:unnamed protein product [Paramecium pentaurelia]|uniref:Transmembrane protein n=1 Tax=Paramecium pentaurelia TaxID=43138 RepID=A0A8S1S0V1_9CILI|nr:unnamed protein product [Paramecium pentaurelia]
MTDQESHILCFNIKATKEQAISISILYTITLSVFFGSLFVFLWTQRTNIILKERSCYILIIQAITTYGFVILYPIAVLFSQNYIYDDISYYTIILACRFFYAFQRPWKLFKLKGLSFIITMAICFISIGLLEAYTQFDQNIFLQNDSEYNIEKVMPRLAFVYISQLILILAIFFMRKVNKFQQFDYWIAFAIELIQFLIKIFLRNQIKFIDCSPSHKIPLYYYIDCFKLSLMLICSTILPLFFQHKSITELPFEMECSTFRLFLAQPQFIQLFYDYLCYFDRTKSQKLNIEETQQGQINQRVNNNYTTLFENEQQFNIFKSSLSKCFISYINFSLWLEKEQNETNINYDNDNEQLLSSEFQFLQDLISEQAVSKMTSSAKYNKQLTNQGINDSGRLDFTQDQININKVEKIWLYKEILYEILKEVFEQYFKFTKSYQTLYENCERNRQIWIRLGQIGLTGNCN